MKFYNALLLLTAALSLTLANNLEVSEDENDVAGAGLDAGFGESSEPEIDQNEAPIEPPSIPPPSVPNTPSTPPSSGPSVPPPSSGPSVPPPSSGPSVPPPSSGPSVPPPSSGPSVPPPSSGPSVPPSAPVTDNTSADSVPGPVSDNTSADGINANGVTADSGEASDDYGNDSSINNADNTQAPADKADVSGDSANADNGEGSDDYGEAENGGAIDNANVDSNDVANANAEAAGENSADEEDSSTGTKAAFGIAGAAALSSAGIFLWVKKSKRNEGYVPSVRSQISMV